MHAGDGLAPAADARRPDRRRGERRQSDRRGAGRSVPPELSRAAGGPPSSALDPSLSRWPRAESDADGGPSASPSAVARIVRTYVAARAVIGVALVVALTAASIAGARLAPISVLVCVGYALQGALLWLLPRFRRLTEPAPPGAERWRQFAVTIGVDLVAFSLLHAFDAGTTFNFGALLALPVLMSGVLAPRLVALGVAAAVALVLLGIAAPGSLRSDAGVLALAQSGLAGIGLFVVALLGGELASRLVREEEAARGSREQARQQAQLNRLMIEEIADGVLVVDAGLQVRAANPAARRLLVSRGTAGAAPFQLRADPAWAELAQAVELALHERRWPEGGRELPLRFGDGPGRMLNLRIRFTRQPTAAAGANGGAAGSEAQDYCVLLMEDVRTAQARARQDKLAAMGRMSAGVAHEIRNPLAAIAQANALLLEDALPPGQAQLATMVADNVRRLQRIVDDVLEVAPGGVIESGEVEARATIAAAVEDWARTAGIELGPGSRLRLDLPMAALPVQFDAEHLRRVLVNLLDNAVRHATPAADAVLLRLAVRDEVSAVLSVASDGEAIAPEVERHLFEPFFSTRSRGSGLGLYICRELCERYGASIEYRPRSAGERHRKGFIVVMRRAIANPAS